MKPERPRWPGVYGIRGWIMCALRGHRLRKFHSGRGDWQECYCGRRQA